MFRAPKPWVAHAVAAWLVVSLLFLAPAASDAAAAVPGRAWELVTTSNTNGVVLIGTRAWSADGDRVAYLSLGPQPGAAAGDLRAHAMATRGPQGWGHEPMTPPFSNPHIEFEFPQALAVSPDLSAWLWASPLPLLAGAPPDPTISVYRRAPGGPLTLLGSGGVRNDGFTFMGASDDLGHAAFQTGTHLLPGDAGRVEGTAAYELVGSSLRLVGVDDAGVPLSTCGSAIGNGNSDPSQAEHAVSRDGRRIFFSVPASAFSSCGEPRRVYVREDGARTIEVSTSSCTRQDCNAPQEVTFTGATPDGSNAFLVTAQQLTDDDVDEGMDLYRRELPGGTLTRLSAGPPGVTADVSQAVVRVSDDGQRVYFVATGALVPGMGETGRPNLYLSDHGTLRFVATVDDINLSSTSITGDGGSLVFTTASALLSSDLDANVDLYRYDAASGALSQVSQGVGGRGSEPLDAGFAPGPPLGLAAFPDQPMRYLSADGRRVFFITSEALLPEDRNATIDVYERVDGVLGLVSSGAGDDDALIYAGASADGRSVFVITQDSLVAADRDGGDADLYVARLGGGFPDPVPALPCVDDACQGPPTGRVQRPSPSSLTQPDAGATPAAFGPRPVRAKVRRQLAATGRARLAVDVPAAGRLSLVVRAPLRVGHPRTQGLAIVAHARTRVRRAGVVRLPIRLSGAARRTLRTRGSLRLTLVVRHSTLGAASRVHVNLERGTPRRPVRRAR